MINSFYIRRYLQGENHELPLSATNALRFPFFYGFDGEKYWEISGLNVHQTKDGEDPVAQGSKNALAILQVGLSLGIPDAIAGTFKWTNNSASARLTDTFEKIVQMPVTEKTELVDPQGIYCELVCSNNVPYKAACFRSEVYFEFANASLPKGIPSRAIVCRYGVSKTQWSQIINIKWYEPASEFADDYFEPYRHISPAFLGVVERDGGKSTVVKDNNTAITMAYTEAVRNKVPYRRWVVLGGITAVAFIFGGAVLLRLRKR